MVLLIALYIVAVVAANLLAATFGPSITILNAFLFIGLDLTTRDRLHDTFGKKNFALKMGVLIASGSILSYALNAKSANIAFASFAAFSAAGVTDTLMYLILDGSPKITKVNVSNAISSLVDSFVFPTLAFGSVMPEIVVGQFLAKVAGGLIWYIVLSGNSRTKIPVQTNE